MNKVSVLLPLDFVYAPLTPTITGFGDKIVSFFSLNPILLTITGFCSIADLSVPFANEFECPAT